MTSQYIQTLYNAISTQLLEIFPLRGNDHAGPEDPDFEEEFADTTFGELFLEVDRPGQKTYIVNLGEHVDTIFRIPRKY